MRASLMQAANQDNLELPSAAFAQDEGLR